MASSRASPPAAPPAAAPEPRGTGPDTPLPRPASLPGLGVFAPFRPGEHQRVETALERLRRLGVRRLRVPVDEAAGPQEWTDWLVPRLAREVEVVPCFRVPSPAPLPDALRLLIERHGQHFDWVELRLVPGQDAPTVAAALDGCMAVAAQHGNRTLLSGRWEDVAPLLAGRLAAKPHAVGVHVSTGPADALFLPVGPHLEAQVQRVRDAVRDVQVWVDVSHATTRHDGLGQLELLQEALSAEGVDRVEWNGLEDDGGPVREAGAGPELRHRSDGGLYDGHGRPKLLAQALEEGRDLAGLRWLVTESLWEPPGNHVVVTGGAGFVGTNLVHRLLNEGERVLVLDSLARPGSLSNLEWLRRMHGNALRVHVADVRDRHAVERAVRGAKAVFHLAAQVAVTTSIEDPRTDLEANVVGTFNVLDALRTAAPDAFLLYASTNKVYGGLEDVDLVARARRYEPRDARERRHGLRPRLAFATPYGCSKGAADQYVVDHARVYGLKAAVFRMSCVYGPHQNGTEDQGWVSHFVRRAAAGEAITLYGDGRQVRDVLHVDDLVEAYLRAMDAPQLVSGRAWDVGGGPHHTTSLLECVDLLEELGLAPEVRHAAERPGDQRYYVSDIRPVQDALGWRPRIGLAEGLRRMLDEVRPPEERVELAA